MRNKYLKEELSRKQHGEQLLELQVQALAKRKESANSADELRDAALRLGYQQDGSQVFYFETIEPQSYDTPATQANQEIITEYTGMKTSSILVIALSGAILAVLIYMTIHYLRIRSFRKNGDERGGYYDF